MGRGEGVWEGRPLSQQVTTAFRQLGGWTRPSLPDDNRSVVFLLSVLNECIRHVWILVIHNWFQIVTYYRV